MILDTALQAALANACRETNKSIDILTTTELLPEIISLLRVTGNTDFTFSKNISEIKVNEILLRTFVLNDKKAITINDFINTWHLMSNMNVLDAAPSITTKEDVTSGDLAILGKLGTIMNDEAFTYDNVYGRDAYIQQMVNILSRRKKSSVLLVGNPGCGKTAIVQGLVARCISGDIPKLEKYKFVSIQGYLLKNMTMNPHGLNELQSFIRTCNSKVIVFIDEFHTICQDERSSSAFTSVIDILKPGLASGAIQIIGATTQQEAKKYVYHDKALTRRLQELKIEDMEDNDVNRILSNITPIYEAFHKCKIQNKSEVLAEVVKLTKRYLSDKHEPDRSIDIIDETLATVSGKIVRESNIKDIEAKIYDLINQGKTKEAHEKLEQLFNKTESNKPINELDIIAFRNVIARKANIPADLLNRSDLERIKQAETFLSNKVIGQDHAVKQFVSAIRKFKTGLANPNRPISILLVGPTGTGKTYICKETANILFDGRKNSFLRFDMTEFSASHSVSTLIGSPPGYVDSDKGGKLTEQVYKNPYSMILFDEIEKANDLVINVLLQILDEGSLTDAMGKNVNFKNCIIVMTSNAGMDHVIQSRNALGFNRLMAKETGNDAIDHKDIIKGLKKFFKPEFINRIDATCIFGYLTKDEVFKILDLEIQQVTSRINIPIIVKQETRQSIIDDYYSEEYGARSIKRGVEDIIVDQIAKMIVDNPNATSLEV